MKALQWLCASEFAVQRALRESELGSETEPFRGELAVEL
mgnify:CR=1 FL=1